MRVAHWAILALISIGATALTACIAVASTILVVWMLQSPPATAAYAVLYSASMLLLATIVVSAIYWIFKATRQEWAAELLSHEDAQKRATMWS